MDVVKAAPLTKNMGTLFPWRMVLVFLLLVYAGMELVSGEWIHFYLMVHTLGAMALLLSAAMIFRQLNDTGYDHLLAQTRVQVNVLKQISTRYLFWLALALAAIALCWLYWKVDVFTMLLALVVLFLDGVYQRWLRPQSPLAVLGAGVAIAMLPLVGASAVTGYVDGSIALLSLLIFLWVPTTIWLLAISRMYSYREASATNLLAVHGVLTVKRMIVFFVGLLCITSLMPFVIDLAGVVYLLGALLLDVIFIYYSCRLLLEQGQSHAMPAYRFSWVYCLGMVALLLFDHYLSFLT